MLIKYFTYFFTFAIIGVASEVLFTSIADFLIHPHREKRWALRGRSGIIMFPIYGMAGMIVYLVNFVFPTWNIFTKGGLLVPLIFFWEYISGSFFRRTFGYICWDYDGKYPSENIKRKKFNVHGLIALEFIPIWYVEVIFAQLILIFLDTHLVF